MFLTKKLRRHSGRIFPRCSIRNELLNEEGLEPQPYWDNWRDYRDGFRGNKDRTMLRNENMGLGGFFNVKRWNKKLRLLILRRKARKEMSKFISQE